MADHIAALQAAGAEVKRLEGELQKIAVERREVLRRQAELTAKRDAAREKRNHLIEVALADPNSRLTKEAIMNAAQVARGTVYRFTTGKGTDR